MSLRHLGFLVARSTLRTAGVDPAGAVFILGHMRCGSTLLLHILLTNPNFIACGERNAPYRSGEDLDKLEIASRISHRSLLRRYRYAVDQINHNHLTPNPELLLDRRVQCVFLIREPRATVQSILHLRRTYYQPWPVEKAVGYYVERLEYLAGCVQRLSGKREFVGLRYDDLVYHTSATLGRLESFFKLASPLREQYETQTFTSKRGDPSPTIRAGRIVRVDRPPVNIPDSELEHAFRAYAACTRILGLE